MCCCVCQSSVTEMPNRGHNEIKYENWNTKLRHEKNGKKKHNCILCVSFHSIHMCTHIGGLTSDLFSFQILSPSGYSSSFVNRLPLIFLFFLSFSRFWMMFILFRFLCFNFLSIVIDSNETARQCDISTDEWCGESKSHDNEFNFNHRFVHHVPVPPYVVYDFRRTMGNEIAIITLLCIFLYLSFTCFISFNGSVDIMVRTYFYFPSN